jgi:hypothetical protein
MRFYTDQHRFYRGVDLHARTLVVCTLDGCARRFWSGVGTVGAESLKPRAGGCRGCVLVTRHVARRRELNASQEKVSAWQLFPVLPACDLAGVRP